jgi:hypothetical protein
MATYINPDISREGILTVGDNVIYSCPANYVATLSAFRIVNPAAYNISFRIERQRPLGSYTYYSFVLDAGDIIQDGSIYTLNSRDRLIINVDVPGTIYSFSGQVYPINPTI